jgi:7-carboxy-7-deazaguanine synthase
MLKIFDLKDEDYNKILPVINIHTCTQGEGKYAGVPHILIRLSGCNLNCQFSDWLCDTAYASWKPEKGTYTLNDIITFIISNPQIKHTMITGGEPTFNPNILIILCEILKTAGHFVTIETNGTIFVPTVADFLSISPKLKNSVPKIGTILPDTYVAREVTQQDQERHIKSRQNYINTKKMIDHHPDYQLKFVVSNDGDYEEIQNIQIELGAPNNKIYLMPEGITNEQLSKRRIPIIEKSIKLGYNYTDRLHVIAYGDVRIS